MHGAWQGATARQPGARQWPHGVEVRVKWATGWVYSRGGRDARLGGLAGKRGPPLSEWPEARLRAVRGAAAEGLWAPGGFRIARRSLTDKRCM